MKQVIFGYVLPNDSGYAAECLELSVSVQADSLSEAVEGLQRAIRQRLKEENLYKMGLAPEPKLLLTFFLGPLKLFQ